MPTFKIRRTLDGKLAGTPVVRQVIGGVGTELKLILHWFGFKPNNDCKCDERARLMDQMGVEWCESHDEQIVMWLRESAQERGVPFVENVARWALYIAVGRARSKLQGA